MGRMRAKEVQIIPWVISDSNYVKCAAPRLDPQKTVFVGALHGMMTAQGLALVFNDLFGGVVYSGLDTDKFKYPIGSGRVTFNNSRSYMKAVAAAFIEIKTPRFCKKVQVDPYLEDTLCSMCGMKQGPYFCRDLGCFNYFCHSCWDLHHSTRPQHKPLMRNIRGLTRARSSQQNDTLYSRGYRRPANGRMGAPQVTIETITVTRPLKVIAFTCCFITVILMVAATSTADWMLSEGWREGLFMQCINAGAPTPLPFGMAEVAGCTDARSASYLRGAAALVIIGLIFDFFGTFLTGLGLRSTDPNKKYKYYRVAIYALILSLIALLLAAIIYPVQFSKDLDKQPPKDGGKVQAAGSLDFDNDGIIDIADPDDDNDGIPDEEDNDDDNDGIKDSNDDDGLLDEDDPDDDNDGFNDDEDNDDDNDGIPDDMETDTDGDGEPDALDDDDDGDGVPEDDDDFDNDGIPDEEDPDDDGDNIPDGEDDDDDNDGITDDIDDDNEGGDLDTDGDGVEDHVDDDSDGDGNEDDDDDADARTYTFGFGYGATWGSIILIFA